MTIRIVTDSTCDLPKETIKELGIGVVPQYINIGDKSYLDEIDLSRRDFYEHLADYDVHPTTAAPGISAFSQIYKKLITEGTSQILSIHISKKLSSTLDAAQSAANEIDEIPIIVRDSEQLSRGMGFQVEAAGRFAEEGKSLDEIVRLLDDISERTFLATRLQTLEYLKRSGRMNPFMISLGSLLQLKPILTMRDGIPRSESVRTRAKAEGRLIELLRRRQPIEKFVILHADARIEAEGFLQKIGDIVPFNQVEIVEITPAIGAHIGPGGIGYALITRKDE